MADSFAGYDVARISFDGANNATAATDALGHTLTFNGAAKLSTASFKEGGSSLSVDGTATTCVNTNASADWDLGAGDFSIDYWMKHSSGGTNFHIGDGTDYSIFLLTVGIVMQVNFNSGATAFNVNTWTEHGSGRWVHYAITRVGNIFTFYVNGRAIKSQEVDITLSWNANMVLTIGNRGVGASFSFGTNAYFDQFRVTKGVSRYTKNFIPPIDENFNSYDTLAVSATTLGPNTRQVSAYGTYSADAIIRAVDDQIQALGWEFYDVVNNSTVTMVYRCLNKDGITYKYVAFLWDKSRWKVTQISMESWDISTQTITNECWNNYRSDGIHGFNVMNCDIILYGSPRHLGMMTYLQGNNSVWSMCVEMEREAAEDTAVGAVPCWGMTYGHKFLLYSSSVAKFDFIAVPRTKNGFTGTNAAQYWTQLTSIGAWGRLGSSNSRFSHFFHSAETTWRAATYGWDTAKKLITHLKPLHDSGTTDAVITPYGRIFMLKAAPPMGGIMDKVAVPVDAEGWFTAGGTDTDHWMLPSNYTGGSNMLSGVAPTYPTVTSWATGNTLNGGCYTGDCMYLATGAGIYKLNVSSGAGGMVAGTSGIYYDTVFDGRYVYGSSTTGVTRVDTKNLDAVLTLAVGAGGTRALVQNGKGYLFATDRTSSTTAMKVHKIDIPALTLISSCTMPSRVTASIMSGLAVDDKGAYVGTTTGNLTTVADVAFGLIDQQAMSGAWVYKPGDRLADSFGCSWRGQHFNALWKLSGASAYSTWYILNPTTGAYVNSIWDVGLTVDTVAPNNKFMGESINCASFGCMAGATAAVANLGVGNVAPDGSANHALNSMGNAALVHDSANAHSRFMVHTGNSVYVGGGDNAVYCAANLYKGSSGTSNHSHTLVPR